MSQFLQLLKKHPDLANLYWNMPEGAGLYFTGAAAYGVGLSGTIVMTQDTMREYVSLLVGVDSSLAAGYVTNADEVYSGLGVFASYGMTDFAGGANGNFASGVSIGIPASAGLSYGWKVDQQSIQHGDRAFSDPYRASDWIVDPADQFVFWNIYENTAYPKVSYQYLEYEDYKAAASFGTPVQAPTTGGNTSDVSSGATKVTGSGLSPVEQSNLRAQPMDSTQFARPLVIDLGPTGSGEDGLQFFDRFSSPIFYDYDGDDYNERTAWVGPNEGMVAWDKNGNGTIDRNEFVLTKGPNSQGKTDLHVILNYFDTDRNGILSATELGAAREGGRLYIWQDRNLDGVPDADEVQLLTNLVSEIDATGVDFLDPTSADYLDRSKLADIDNDGNLDAIAEVRFRDGSMIYGTAAVKLVNGGTTTADDMAFAYNEIGVQQEADGPAPASSARLLRSSLSVTPANA